jgi:hypothetical protein
MQMAVAQAINAFSLPVSKRKIIAAIEAFLTTTSKRKWKRRLKGKQWLLGGQHNSEYHLTMHEHTSVGCDR